MVVNAPLYKEPPLSSDDTYHGHPTRDHVAPYDPTNLAGAAGGAALYRGDKLEDRYAGAFIDLASDKSQLDAIEADVSALSEMLGSSPDLQRTLSNPILSRAAQAELLAKIADKLKLQQLTHNFLQLIAKKRRQSGLASILAAFQTEVARRRGELRATVTSATALNEAQQAALTQALSTQNKDAKITLDVIIDPTLLGGMTIRIGSRLYDRSLAGQLTRLQHKLTQAA